MIEKVSRVVPSVRKVVEDHLRRCAVNDSVKSLLVGDFVFLSKLAVESSLVDTVRRIVDVENLFSTSAIK